MRVVWGVGMRTKRETSEWRQVEQERVNRYRSEREGARQDSKRDVKGVKVT